MKIKSITIKNVRGLSNHTVPLNMIPNKPSILVAPNGSGKSSFAMAFQWLNRDRIKIKPNDAYNGDVNNKPELIIETAEPNKVYTATEDTNEISKLFGVYVINNAISVALPGLKTGIPMGRAKLVVNDIKLLGPQPDNCDIIDSFEETYHLDKAQKGLFPALTDLLASKQFMAIIDEDKLKCGAIHLRRITEFLERSNQYEGTIDSKYKRILDDDSDALLKIECVKYAFDIISVQHPSDNPPKNLLRAIRLVCLYKNEPVSFLTRQRFLRYQKDLDDIISTFDSLKLTWRDIKPRIIKGKLILRIDDAQKISNGERDTLSFLGQLIKAKNIFTKEHNILIIDEVFDYMDDANLTAAQHYINLFIKTLKKEGKNIYPIILSHINPSYFRTFAFQEMKVYYLNQLSHPHLSDNMMKLLTRRSHLEKTNHEGYEMISKYMLHYHSDYSIPMGETIDMSEPNWGDIPTFKSYCSKHLNKYIKNEDFDALAACVGLREVIERFCYKQLENEDYKAQFLSKNGTEAKIEYASEVGVTIPDTFSLLGLIYNDPMHPLNKSNTDLRQTLYSRLDNNTIRKMIADICKMESEITPSI